MIRKPSQRTLTAICNRRNRTRRSKTIWNIRFVHATLPPNQVVGAAVTADTLWIIIDPTKPHARDHLIKLVQNWPVNYGGGEGLVTAFFDAGYLTGLASSDGGGPEPARPLGPSGRPLQGGRARR